MYFEKNYQGSFPQNLIFEFGILSTRADCSPLMDDLYLRHEAGAVNLHACHHSDLKTIHFLKNEKFCSASNLIPATIHAPSKQESERHLEELSW
jgi:hypothetical protein